MSNTKIGKALIENINLAGSLCSIIALIMVVTVKLDIVVWLSIVVGVLFGISILGTLFYVFKYLLSNSSWCKYLNNFFSKSAYWMFVMLIALGFSVFLGVLFGMLTNAGIEMLRSGIRDLFS